MKRVPLTIRGAEKMKQELEYLKHVRRPEISMAIAEARAHGDLKENADYHAAREAQGFCEARIKLLESKLSHAEIIDPKKLPKTGVVVFGVTVEVEDLNTQAKSTYRLVGDDEADLKEHAISINSPIARGMIGKRVGDEVLVQTPGGEVVLAIHGVLYE